MSERQLLVFTDLDGTLLDHNSYSFQAALPALRRLKEMAIPVILNSSKTRPEMEALKQQLDNHTPFIVENGAAAIIPAGNLGRDSGLVVSFSAPLDEVLDALQELRQAGFQFRSFADMEAAEVAKVTGLPNMAAARAKQRIGTEPLLWLGSDVELEQFTRQLNQRGLQLIKGGRFYHAMGQYDKADAMQYLVKRYQSCYPDREIITIALGDSPNDARMLECADYAVIIKGVNSDKLNITGAGEVLRSEGEGPAGWDECIQSLLNRLL
ncbi:MAG: mannosyl-3-phosphoglycerate phosphatase [Pseudomonadales bacterium]|nr:mannosyl-3-phosphoglycerate phosphatase [Pseudomonadales bacterium]